MAGHQSLADVLREYSGEQSLFEHLGEFVCHYASIEKYCHLLFDQMSGLRREVARTIMGGSQLSSLLTVLTRIVDFSALEESQKAEYHGCIDHLNAITTFRHTLIHRGAEAEPGGRITSSNEMIAKSKEAVEILRFHSDDIKAAADDAFRLSLRLLFILAPKGKASLSDELQKKIYGPWLYKPVQPDRPHQPPRNTRRSKRPQRHSSQA